MKKIYSSLYRSIRETPFFGRTVVVLSFFCLFIKQIFIFLAYGQSFQEITGLATFEHYLGYFVSDFLVCLVLLGLVVINILIKKTFIKIINNIIVSGIFLLFVLDIFTMYFFQSRISILDMSQFIDPSLGSFSGMIFSIIMVVCIIGILTFFIVQSLRFKKNQKILLSLYFGIFALASFGMGIFAPGGLRSLPDNILSTNISAISQYFNVLGDDNIPDIYEKFFGKKRGLNQKPNIIVVFAESFSPIDSMRVGGVNNNLPYFDMIQKQGITFTNFVNNGCTSDTAHVGLLLGVEPLRLVGSQVTSYSGYKVYGDSLPAFFNKQGYKTTFISSVDLNFLDQRDFLSGIGFSQIIGEESFKTDKKYVFDAAPDHNLYNKTLETIKNTTGSYFIKIQNISFHKPYNTPYGKTKEDALRYADKSLFYFYLQLKKSGFFENGVLVVVADHRKMEPLEDKEKDALGEYRYTKGLATIVGTNIPAGIINNNVIQHTDMFYSLKYFVGRGMITLSKIFNDAFSLIKNRNRGIIYCRYFQNNNKYTIVGGPTSGKIFNTLPDIASSHKFIYQYLSSYLSFQQSSGLTLTGNSMIIIGHQGSPKQVPENSLEGFLLAKKNGANGIEFDVSYTKDNKNLVLHGERMRATTCGQDYIVGNHNLQELQEKCPLKNGETLRTLEDMLKSVNGMFDYYFVEIKVYDVKDAEQQTFDAIKTVKKLGMQDRVIFTSYDKTANYILGSYKDIVAGWDTFDIGDLELLPNANHQYFLMPYNLITDTTAQEAANFGKEMVVYTVNTTGDLEKAYRQGVRMVMTDDVPLIKGWADNNLNQY
ncbi:MAG: glycerophosphodiester phosphodiesterase family protein [Candidatus Absconditabacterales bacterium]